MEKKKTKEEAHVYRPLLLVWACLVGCINIVRSTRRRRNTQLQVQRASSSLECDGCIVSPPGRKVEGSVDNKNWHGRGVLEGRVVLHHQKYSQEQVTRWGRLMQTRERKHSAQLKVS